MPGRVGISVGVAAVGVLVTSGCGVAVGATLVGVGVAATGVGVAAAGVGVAAPPLVLMTTSIQA